MWKNYFRIALRTLRRNKVHATINVVGLAIGIACCLLIGLYVRHELSYDDYHAEKDRVYRVTRSWVDADGATTLHLARVAAPIGPLLEESMPDVQAAARAWGTELTVEHEGEYFTEDDAYFVEPALFDLLTVDFVEGDPATALQHPYTLVLTTSTAERYFGERGAVGRVLRIGGQDYEVTGVVADPPSNTHIPFGLLGSFATLEAEFSPDTWTNWGWNNYATYVLLAEGADAAALEARLPALLDAHYEPDASTETQLHLQALPRIHLYSHLDAELSPPGDIRYVYLFSVVALLVLLIACVNFVNLMTARAVRRAREVGVRKALGAQRSQLVRQFLGETLVLAAIALTLALVFARLASPLFDDFAGFSPSLFGSSPLFLPLFLAGLLAVVAVAAGTYPALVLSGYRPAVALRGAGSGTWHSRLRTGLVVGQFAVAIALLAGVLTVYQQLDYVQTKRLGFDKEQLVVLPTTTEMRGDLVRLRERLLAHEHVVAVGASQRVPSNPLLDTIDGAAEVDGAMRPFRDVPAVAADPGFVPTYGMTMAAGRPLSFDRATDTTEAFVLNEAAVRQLGWPSAEAAIGKAFVVEGRSSGFTRRGRVVGVVADFHFESLRERIAPLILHNLRPDFLWNVTVKVAGDDLAGTIDFLEAQWAPYLENEPLDYAFVDDAFGALYEAEQRLGRLFGLFAALAVLIACLGLFGLAAYVAEQRTKEIGVRKVLGASARSVVLLITGHFARLVLAALVLATPLAYLALRRWLESFAYHAQPAWWVFLLAGGATLAVALGTVSYHALRAAWADPVESLRHE